MTGQATKALTDPSSNLSAPGSLVNDTPPTLGKDTPGLFVNSDGVYQIKYSASIGADIANLSGQNSTISVIRDWNSESRASAKRYGATSKQYIEWVNATLFPAIYGSPKSATAPGGGSEGALTGLTLNTLTLKDLYIIIGVVLVGVLVLIIVAKNIKPMAQTVEKVAPLAPAL